VDLLRPGGTAAAGTGTAALAKAARLVQLLCRTYFGRKVLLGAGLREVLQEALLSEDAKLKVICAGIVITIASDADDTPGELVDGGIVATLAPLLLSETIDVQEAVGPARYCSPRHRTQSN